jgi:hypothetical protein
MEKEEQEAAGSEGVEGAQPGGTKLRFVRSCGWMLSVCQLRLYARRDTQSDRPYSSSKIGTERA